MAGRFGTFPSVSRIAALSMTDEQRATLERWVRAGTTPQRLVFRSQIVLLAASGMPSKHVAHQLDTSQDMPWCTTPLRAESLP